MEETNMSLVMDEIKNANEDELRKVIEDWFEKTRTDGLKIGAQFISAAIYGSILKNLNKAKPSLRDYERCIKDIRKVIDVQLAQQKETTANVVEETTDDGTTE